MLEAMRCVDEGIAPEAIDEAMLAFGMPMGPIELIDTVGLDIAMAAGKQLGDGAEAPKCLLQKVEAVTAFDAHGQGLVRVLIDGRSDDVLVLPAAGGGDIAVHPYRLRAPFVQLLDVLQYQVVQRADELAVRVVVRATAPRDLPEKVEQAVESALARAGTRSPVRVEVVDEIAREPGHAAKVKLVVSEVGRPSEG